MLKLLIGILSLLTITVCNSGDAAIEDKRQDTQQIKGVLYNKDVLFKPQMWVLEENNGESGFVEQGIEIKNYGGMSLWFKAKLIAPVQIEYTVTMLDGDTRYDRVSDLNAFWMAQDPNNSGNLFAAELKRTGAFEQYHKFKLYYVGTGVHNNTKTRFRRYDGNTERPLLPEHDLIGKYLLEANIPYKIKIISTKAGTQFYRNEQLIFDLQDDHAYTEGWFAFRTFRSHQLISDFKVSLLIE